MAEQITESMGGKVGVRIHVADTNPNGNGGMFYEVVLRDGEPVLQVTISETKPGGRTYLHIAEHSIAALEEVLLRLNLSAFTENSGTKNPSI